jgi:hypothetical protein
MQGQLITVINQLLIVTDVEGSGCDVTNMTKKVKSADIPSWGINSERRFHSVISFVLSHTHSLLIKLFAVIYYKNFSPRIQNL